MSNPGNQATTPNGGGGPMYSQPIMNVPAQQQLQLQQQQQQQLQLQQQHFQQALPAGPVPIIPLGPSNATTVMQTSPLVGGPIVGQIPTAVLSLNNQGHPNVFWQQQALNDAAVIAAATAAAATAAAEPDDPAGFRPITSDASVLGPNVKVVPTANRSSGKSNSKNTNTTSTAARKNKTTPKTHASTMGGKVTFKNEGDESMMTGGSSEANMRDESAGMVVSSSSIVDESEVTDRSQLNRERNREHARSTRLRKKAYIQKLKDMASGLRAVQTEEIRQRRISMQKMMEVQRVRRSVVHTFLNYHSNYESDPAKWNILVEDNFTLKQPITPYRSFRRSEVDRDCRITRGVDALICEAASISVMTERLGCRNARWQRIKRTDFLDSINRDMVDKEIFAVRPPESSLSSDSSVESNRISSHKNASSTTGPLDTAEMSQKDFCRKISSSCDSLGASSSVTEPMAKRQKTEKDAASNPRSKSVAVSLPATSDSTNVLTANHPSESSSGAASTDSSIPTQSLSLSQLRKMNSEQIACYYAINEDDMIMIDDVMMCPFVYRTKNAVLCGALQDCVVPGMLRAQFSSTNKLVGVEFVFDSMGFMQQLDAGNGSDITAQVIPSSLEMALMDCTHEARVITEAKSPHKILHVNEAWTAMTKYSQMEAEGKQFMALLSGKNTDPKALTRPGKPIHRLEEVSKGRPACSTNIHYRKSGSPFVNFLCSYPLTNAEDEITHLLHVCLELPKMFLVKE